MQLYVSEPGLTIPRANITPDDGAIYFGFETSRFPEGLSSPVRYGESMREDGKLIEQPDNELNQFPYPLQIESDDIADASLSNVRTGCEPGVGGCFKVGLAKLSGNHELLVEDFECGETLRTWETFD